ncbi:MAG TPA: RodZ domain-containing protein [Steroidobacteraceae bacterium]|nr:RodZ domain-containing protein [Steroidobacteraceae bacterium]
MAEGIGARLRGARERSRLTILQAAERLHVDPDILEALEADDFAALGAPVYVKGHLRHYAELVGESPEALFEIYSQGARVPPPDLTRVPKPVPDDTGRLVAPAVIVVIGFAVAGTVWWGLSLSHRQWFVTASHPVPITVPAAAPVESEPVSLTLGAGTAAQKGSAGPVPSSNGRRQAAVTPPAHGDVYVVFTYSADSWTEVHDATGRRLLYGLSTSPATRKLEGVPPLSVLLGDASGVTVEVGGRTASISRFVRPDHTAWFLIAADGRLLAAPRRNGG